MSLEFWTNSQRDIGMVAEPNEYLEKSQVMNVQIFTVILVMIAVQKSLFIVDN